MITYILKTYLFVWHSAINGGCFIYAHFFSLHFGVFIASFRSILESAQYWHFFENVHAYHIQATCSKYICFFHSPHLLGWLNLLALCPFIRQATVFHFIHSNVCVCVLVCFFFFSFLFPLLFGFWPTWYKVHVWAPSLHRQHIYARFFSCFSHSCAFCIFVFVVFFFLSCSSLPYQAKQTYLYHIIDTLT